MTPTKGIIVNIGKLDERVEQLKSELANAEREAAAAKEILEYRPELYLAKVMFDNEYRVRADYMVSPQPIEKQTEYIKDAKVLLDATDGNVEAAERVYFTVKNNRSWK